jgi:anti-sigma B factor antagonist
VIDYHRFTTGPDREILVIQVSGRLDNDSSPFFFDCLEGEIEEGHTQVVLDCSELSFLSSLGIGTLIRIQSRLRQRGGTVKLAAVQGVVADVLHVVHLDRLLDIYPDIDAAVAAFAAD